MAQQTTNPIWAVQDRSLFINIAFWVFVIGSICYLIPNNPKSPIAVMHNISAIGLFAVISTFFLLEGADMFLKQGFIQEGRQEGQREERARVINTLEEEQEQNPEQASMIKRIKEKVQQEGYLGR